MTATTPSLTTLLERVRSLAVDAGVFGRVTIQANELLCEAAASAEPAHYRLGMDGDRLWVSLTMADRWLSESIESDLMHTGDSMEELLEEELVELGFDHGPLPIEHFRSDARLFTFRSPLPIEIEHVAAPNAAETAATCLLAYEACFRNLGDMSAGNDEE
ncbi:MAG: hypothetical protein KF866_12125 [Phycisphaeraceae bacterium]|nr:hypothetical protein [Phycisphaeraceae bacterium]MCW5755281.1 hypothetical protein [Phycisphaeraceae bacterium]